MREREDEERDEDETAEEENVGEKYNLGSRGDPQLTGAAAARSSQSKTPHYYSVVFTEFQPSCYNVTLSSYMCHY